METTNWHKKRRMTRRGMLTGLVLGGLAASALLLAGRAARAERAAGLDRPDASAGPVQGNINTATVRVAESEAGNVVADAARAAGGADLAFVPAFAFKPGASVPRPASADQAAALVDPPSDTVVVLSLTGKKIREALERSVSYAPQPSAGFLQVSGIRFTFDPRKDSPARVSGVTVNGQPLDDNKTYKVATTRPLGNGQQGYHQVWSRSSVVNDTGKTLAAALAEWASARGGSVSGAVEGRIVQAGK